MNTKFFRITIFVLALALATLACGLVADEPTPDDGVLATETEAGVAPPTVSEEEAQPTGTAEPTATEEPANPPEITLDEEYHSNVGGFVFRPLPGYDLEDEDGFVTLQDKDGDPDNSPVIVLFWDEIDESLTIDDLFAEQVENIATPDLQISEPTKLLVNGCAARSVDITGNSEGDEISARYTVVLIKPGRGFIFMGISPVEQWEQFSPLAKAVEDSIWFTIPQTSDPSEAANFALDDEYRSLDGGFAFRPISGYEFEETFGFASMTAPDGDTETGPMILMIGDVLEEATSLDELREKHLSTISSDDVQISDPVDILVDGAPGVSLDISGTDDGVEVAGRIVIVLVNPTQQLTIMAGAPADRWESEFAPIVDAVLASVTFFEPGTGSGDVPEDDEPGELVSLGDEYRSEKGGYLFSEVPTYSLEETDGYVYLLAPDGDSQIGPSIFLMGGTRGESLTLDELYDEQIQNIDPKDDVIFSPTRDVTVGGAPGRSVDLIGTTNEGLDMSARITVVLVNPNQMFFMGVISPPERWEDVSGIYEALQASVAFFEPGTDPPAAVQPQGEEIRQWAKYAYASSSYDDPDWHASQATGAPDTLIDECDDLPTAWASYDSDTVEWLELVYETPVIPTEINIIQTHSPDQVIKVELIDQAGLYQEVYTGVPVDRWMECPFTLSIPVNVDYAVGGLKITIDQSVIDSPWNEIDAVELVGFPIE